jgi:hypothetical protein
MRTASTKASSPLAAVLPTALESDSEADSLEDEEQFKARRCAGLSHLGADVVQPSQAQIRACAEWTLLGAARGIRRLRGAGAHARTGVHAALVAPVALHRSAALPTGAVHRPCCRRTPPEQRALRQALATVTADARDAAWVAAALRARMGDAAIELGACVHRSPRPRGACARAAAA